MAGHSQTILSHPEPPDCLHHEDYTVAILCPMGDELSPVLALLDEVHDNLSTSRDQNAYKLGKMGHHNVVVAGMPEIGNNAAAMVVTQLLNDFSRIRFGLLVGIGGGIPDEDYEDDDLNDIRLGDVVVSHSHGARGGVIQFDRGKSTTEGFVVTGYQSKPPHVLAANVEILKATHNLHGHSILRYLDDMLEKYPGMKEKYSTPGTERDCLFEASYTHGNSKTCKKCDISRSIQREPRTTGSPRVHYGTIGSSNTVIKDAHKRDELRDMGILCVEMEAAGLMEAFPCLVIRGISDYADSHKNKKWQPYAAATAAAYLKELLLQIPVGEVQRTQSVTDALEGLSMKVDQVDQRTRRVQEQVQTGAAEMKILDWLSSKDVNFSSLQNESQQAHTAGTGQWLLDHRDYQNWRNHEPGLLWLHGVAGCGKTILCSTIIRDLQENFPHLAYWYFRFDNQILQDVSQMLRSTIRQLSVSPLPDEIRSLYDRHGQRGSEPSVEELVAALNAAIESLTQDVYLVFDALDECPHQDKKGQRDQLLSCVKNLMMTHSNLHLLVTSRPEPDIEIHLRPVASCDFDIELPIRSDVERFVKVALEDPRLASWTEEVRDQIIAKLLEYEERRFRWADLQIKRFAQCPTIEQLKVAMDSVPKDLEAAYRQAFDAIDDENTAHVTKIMMWLAVSLEPLAAEQIAAVVGFRDPDFVLQICSTLLVTIIDEDTTRIIKLAHFSVKEFLVLKLYENSTQWYRFTMEYANKSIALFALQGLLYPQHQLKNILPYAAQYWPRHAIEGIKADDQLELEEQICLLFSEKFRKQFLGWLKMHDPDNVNGYLGHRIAEPLYYASLLGFQTVVSNIWVGISQLSKSEGRYGNALNAAAINGNVAVVRWMLQSCRISARFLDLVRVAGEINANVTDCVIEICNGAEDLIITEGVILAAAENESSGQQVMKVLLEKRSNEVQITEEIVRAAAGNWDSGQQLMDLLLTQRRDEVPITENVVKTAFSNQYSGRQVLKVILEHTNSDPQIIEIVIRAAIANGENGQQVMELLLEEGRNGNESRFTQDAISLITGNFDAPAVQNLLEKRKDTIHITEMAIIAAAGSYYYGPQVMNALLGATRDEVDITEGVIMAVVGNRRSGQEVLEVLLKKTAPKSYITNSVISLVAKCFDAHAVELLLEKIPDDIQLTEEVLKGAASNGRDGQQVLEVLLGKSGNQIHHITEQVVRTAARNFHSGQQVMELILSKRADGVRITDQVFMLVACHWKEESLMKLLSESIEYDAIKERLASATNFGNMAAVEALRKRRRHLINTLYLAISRGDIDTAERLLKDGVSPKTNGPDGWTLLMHASRYGTTDIAELLLTHGADLTKKHEDGRTALSIASSHGRLKIVDMLLRKGADHTAKDERGYTPLMYASKEGYVDIAELLLDHGADHTATDEKGQRALDKAAHYGNLEIANLLLRRGADPQASNLNGRTALMVASAKGYSDIVELLLENGADLNIADQHGDTALIWASFKGHMEVANLLIERGANLNIANQYGYTALYAASLNGHMEVSNLLIERGADLNIANQYGHTALHTASLNGHVEVANLLIERGANLNIANQYGYTALYAASLNGHMEVSNLLIERGADLSIVNNDGDTALHFASCKANAKIIELLLKSGADSTIRDGTGSSAFHLACLYGHTEAVNTFIEHGVDIRITDERGCPPLHLAMWKGHTNVAEVLLSMDSCNPHLREACGFTAFDTAAQKGDTDMIDLLAGKNPEPPPGSNDVEGAHKVSRAIEKFKGFWSRS
ncbi:hypothetical protein PFICI_07493 [Pestalotiopsis fici W106-1]|uniref:Uncharacterized protein n=1 Tax=Pestalotiopsis fici (strain W106-1 / CGMCC3.15140) TaxID=1229662 RepID=W3X1S1_PESFW|nr:uncharacterized protein PFICI_07493 [Pestalotiopsis fici W106-1]ETS79964.1 hypothetical protein PFICI_07493 [Pestalotiopsis fici W106-1]